MTVAACSLSPDPDLVEIHAAAADREKPPLIVIPGIMGSRLVGTTTGDEVWPGSLLDLVVGSAGRFDQLALPPDDAGDAVEPSGLFFQVLGEQYYDQLVEALTEAGGYDCVPAAEASAKSDWLLMAWHWRRDLVHAAAELDALVDRLRRLRDDPSLKVDLLGHSAGGLVIRYFIRYGGHDVLGGSPPSDASGATYGIDKVNRALLLGVPNFGSIYGLQQMLRGREVGRVFIQPELVATMPSLYQLLPHPERAWMVDVEGNRLDRDLYDPAVWRLYQWSIYAPGVRDRIDAGSPGFGEWSFAELEAEFARSLRRAKAFLLRQVRQREGDGDQIPDLLVGNDRAPGRHAGHLDAVLDDPEPLGRRPVERDLRKGRRFRPHVAGHVRPLASRRAMADGAFGRVGLHALLRDPLRPDRGHDDLRRRRTRPSSRAISPAPSASPASAARWRRR